MMESKKEVTIGILAVQGDFAMHAAMLDRIGLPWKLTSRLPADGAWASP